MAREILMEEPKGGRFRVRFPYSRRAVQLITATIPAEERKPPRMGFDTATASWAFPLDAWDDIEGIVQQVFPDLPFAVVGELPEFIPYDPNKEDQ